MRILTIALLFLIPVSFYASAQPNSGGLAERVAELEAQVDVLAAALQEAQEVFQFVHVETEEINNLAGPHWIIEGANVHVRSGSGTTHDSCWPGAPGYPNCEILTGLGNLIVGYNERRTRPPPIRGDKRSGSHNLVVGTLNSYSSFAGFVAGSSNEITSAYATVTGGQSNEASSLLSSVCGGRENVASGAGASVSGGFRNVASGTFSSVSGGDDRVAPDDFNWAAGELFEEN